MKNVISFLCLAFLGANSANAQLSPISESDFATSAVTIDFDTVSTDLSRLEDVFGLHFLGDVDVGSFIPASEVGFSGGVSFGGFGRGRSWVNRFSIRYTDLGAEFDEPVAAFGGYFGRIENFTNRHASRIAIRALDLNSNEIGSTRILLPGQFNSPIWVGFQSDIPISRVEFLGNDRGFFAIDDFTFGEPLLLGDVNLDSVVDLSDIAPFIQILITGNYLREADVDQSGEVTFDDIAPFIVILTGN